MKKYYILGVVLAFMLPTLLFCKEEATALSAIANW